MTWQVWWPQRHPLHATLAVVFVFALAIAVHFSFESSVYPVLTILILGAAILEAYLPVRFTLDQEGVTKGTVLRCRRKRWSQLVAYYPHGDDGVLVTVSPHRRRLRAYSSGIYLQYGNNRRAVLNYTAKYLPVGR